MNAAKTKRTLLNVLGLCGVLSLLSYTAAVLFSPLAYPGYNWMAQAVSDLSAENAPSKELWEQLACLHHYCGLVSVMAVCVFVQRKLNKAMRVGIYLFAAMNWVSAVGYKLFPLSESGFGGSFQDTMHIAVTALVVLLSIASLVLIIIGGFRSGDHKALAVLALVALLLMFVGAMGSNAAPKEYFGIFERFSVFSAVAFNAVLGIYLFNGFFEKEPAQTAAE